MTTAHTPVAVDQTSTELAIVGGQTRFNDVQVAVLRQIGLEDATEEDLEVFFHHAKRTGLDPFARQIYMIGRETDVKVRVPTPNGGTRTEVQRMTKFTIQTGIDGYRLIGKRAARREGVVVSNDDPLWCGKDGGWRDFWIEGTPAAAKYTIRVDGSPNTATCMFSEFAQYSGRGELTAMWKKMPANQLAVRAEAAAWRKAFPADFSGVTLEGTEGMVIDADGAPVRVPSTRRGVDGLREAITEGGGPADGSDEAEGLAPELPATGPQNRKMHALFREADVTDRDERLLVTGKIIGHEIDTSSALTISQASMLIDTLEELAKQGILAASVTAMLNEGLIEQESADQETEGK